MTRIPLWDRSLRAAIAVVGFPLTVYQTLVSLYHLQKYKPPGKLVAIGDRSLHAVVMGEQQAGSPTVVLESGMGGGALDWSLVQGELAKDALVISYDRAGFGWSTKTIQEPTCERYVSDLRDLLRRLNLKPPYLLVGHSYGGMMMRLFASRFPDEVEGLVLVDAVHEAQYLPRNIIGERKTARKRTLNLSRLGYICSPIGLPRMVKRHIGVRRLPPEIQCIVTSLGRRNNAFQAVYSELLCTEESARQLKHAPPLRQDLPVIVLTAGKQNESWKKGQEAFLQLTDQTTQLVVQNSWHSIQIHQPGAVIEAIQCLLRKGEPSSKSSATFLR